MNLPEDAATFDHIAHGIFDLVIPALIGWALAFGRKHLGHLMLNRTIKQAAGIGYAEMMRRGAGVTGINDAITEATNFVERHAINPGDRTEIADLIRAELGALLAVPRRTPAAPDSLP